MRLLSQTRLHTNGKKRTEIIKLAEDPFLYFYRHLNWRCPPTIYAWRLETLGAATAMTTEEEK